MVKRFPKMQSLLLLILLMALVISGCGTKGYQPPAPVTAYTVSGIVVDGNNEPLEGVTILFSEPFEDKSVTTIADGTWTQSGLYESVTITPSLPEYEFEPSSVVVTKATSGIKFTGSKIPPYSGSGQITIGEKPSTANLDLTQVVLKYEYPVGNPQEVHPDASGNWQISGVTGTVTVTPTLAGWEFVPASFNMTQAGTNYNFTANRAYSGAEVRTMANLVALSATTPDPVPIVSSGTVTIGTDTITAAEAFYLLAKYLVLYNPTKTGDANPVGTRPDWVGYRAIAAPAALSAPKTGGYIWWDDYMSASRSLVETLESTPTIPSEFTIRWNQDGSVSGPRTDQIIRADQVLNILARAVKWESANNNLPNNVSLRNCTPPAGTNPWPAE